MQISVDFTDVVDQPNIRQKAPVTDQKESVTPFRSIEKVSKSRFPPQTFMRNQRQQLRDRSFHQEHQHSKYYSALHKHRMHAYKSPANILHAGHPTVMQLREHITPAPRHSPHYKESGFAGLALSPLKSTKKLVKMNAGIMNIQIINKKPM